MLDFSVQDKKRIRVIIDSDTACEADDPFAIAHALLSPKLIVKAIVAEHFAEPGSTEKSFDAAKIVTDALGSSVPVLMGEESPGLTDELSEGVKAIIREARADDSHPLFLLCLGALTNIARAFRAAPDIMSCVTVVTIGGHGYDGEIPWREYNFGNDPDAANVVLSSEAEVWQIPSNVYGTIRVGLAELQDKVKPCGKIGAYLFQQMIDYNNTPRAGWTPGESWTLGDSPAVAVTLDPSCGTAKWQQARYVNADTAYGDSIPGRMIRVFQRIDSRYLLEDFYAKLKLTQTVKKEPAL